MPDTVKFEGEGSPQNVAYKLLMLTRANENLDSRKKLLDAYSECLEAAWGQRTVAQDTR